jgi:hypothetical protein
MFGNTNTTLTEQEHKHRCAVRQMLAYRKAWGLKKFQIYIRHERTIKLWLTLQVDFLKQWELKNRGEWNKWL